jgi:hyperosmotically inducible protein
MKIKLMASCFLIGALLAPVVGYTADSDTDRSHPKAFVKDSVITTKIKSKLAAENLDSTMYIRVDTDSDGVVWLSGTAKTQAEIDKTLSIARGTEGVKSVENHIKIK